MGFFYGKRKKKRATLWDWESMRFHFGEVRGPGLEKGLMGKADYERCKSIFFS